MKDMDVISIYISHPERKVQICATLEANLKCYLEFLGRHVHCFAWSHEDMVDLDLDIATYYLKVKEESTPVRQKRRKFAPKKRTK